jgi:hypothetical protein
MQDEQDTGESKRAERHIARVKRAAGEGAHVEGVEYEGDVVEGGYPEANREPQDHDTTLEGAPLEASDTDKDQ